MNARILLLLVALLPAGVFSTSCAYRGEHNRTALVGGAGLGPDYKYRDTRFTTYEVSPYVPNVDWNKTTPVNYFSGKYYQNSKYRCAPLVRYGSQGRVTVAHQDTLHYHTGDRYYGGDYVPGNLYRHSHHGFRPHDHAIKPKEAN